jgi:hypothetical protein
MPEPEPVDGFEFGVTRNYGANSDSIRLPRNFGKVIDVKTNQFVLWVRSGGTSLWSVELLFDHTDSPYLASGWRRFCQRHEIVAGHFIVFNYDREHHITVSIFDQTMCRRHYVATARGKATVSSSEEDN